MKINFFILIAQLPQGKNKKSFICKFCFNAI